MFKAKDISPSSQTTHYSSFGTQSCKWVGLSNSNDFEVDKTCLITKIVAALSSIWLIIIFKKSWSNITCAPKRRATPLTSLSFRTILLLDLGLGPYYDLILVYLFLLVGPLLNEYRTSLLLKDIFLHFFFFVWWGTSRPRFRWSLIKPWIHKTTYWYPVHYWTF